MLLLREIGICAQPDLLPLGHSFVNPQDLHAIS